MGGPITSLSLLADYLALVYHEARNVRHLTHRGFVDAAPWRHLTSLPVNRELAWRELQSARAEAREAKTPRAVLSVFERRFRISLAQLIELYGHPKWRGGAHGGNAWKGISELVRRAAKHLEGDRFTEAEADFALLAQAHQNTRLVSEKLRDLDRVLENAV
jgi:hypothetical protein